MIAWALARGIPVSATIACSVSGSDSFASSSRTRSARLTAGTPDTLRRVERRLAAAPRPHRGMAGAPLVIGLTARGRARVEQGRRAVLGDGDPAQSPACGAHLELPVP